MLRFRLRAALGVSCVLATAPVALAGQQAIPIREHLKQQWKNELATFPFSAGKCQCHPESIRLIGAGVVSPGDRLVDFVVLDDLVVAREADGNVRQIVQPVVLGAVAATRELDANFVDRIPPGNVVNMVVDGFVLAGRQRATVATGKHDAAIARLVDVAIDDCMVATTLDLDGIAAQIAQNATGNLDCLAFRNRDARAARRLDCEALKRHVAHVSKRQGVAHDRYGYIVGSDVARCGIIQSFGGRRPEVKNTGFAVQKPLAGAIQFAEQVESVEPLSGAIAVAVRMTLLKAQPPDQPSE